jgi:hypothetical protein
LCVSLAAAWQVPLNAAGWGGTRVLKLEKI